MLHYLIELAIWMLGFFFAGCCIGCLLKKLFGAEELSVASVSATAPVADAATAATVAAPAWKPSTPEIPKRVPDLPKSEMPASSAWTKPVIPPAPGMKPAKFEPPLKPTEAAKPTTAEVASAEALPLASASTTGKQERPKGIAAARGGKPDDLQRISGIGPKNEKVLHGLGFFHFDQIAAWSNEQVNWVDNHLKFNGRIRREEWIKQAGLLASGKEDEFKRQYGTGGLRNRQGERISASRTRRS